MIVQSIFKKKKKPFHKLWAFHLQLINLISVKITYSFFTDKYYLVATVQIYCSYFVSIYL